MSIVPPVSSPVRGVQVINIEFQDTLGKEINPGLVGTYPGYTSIDSLYSELSILFVHLMLTV